MVRRAKAAGGGKSAEGAGNRLINFEVVGAKTGLFVYAAVLIVGLAVKPRLLTASCQAPPWLLLMLFILLLIILIILLFNLHLLVFCSRLALKQ